MNENHLAEADQHNHPSTPLVKGSTLLRTRKLQVGTDKIIVVPTVFSLLLAMLILSAPSVLVLGGFSSLSRDPGPATVTLGLGVLGMGITFILLLKVWSARICFDKQSGNMVKSGLLLNFGPDLSRWVCSLAPPNEPQKIIPLTELVELHVLEEWSKVGLERPRKFMGYELIVVARDKSRHLLMDHGDKRKLEDDAEVISKFLGIPITRFAAKTPQTPDAVIF